MLCQAEHSKELCTSLRGKVKNQSERLFYGFPLSSTFVKTGTKAFCNTENKIFFGINTKSGRVPISIFLSTSSFLFFFFLFSASFIFSASLQKTNHKLAV